MGAFGDYAKTYAESEAVVRWISGFLLSFFEVLLVFLLEIVYTVCMSGQIYNIIHDIPLVVKDKNGETQWMSSRGSRDQLGAEGIIMAVSSKY